MRQRDIALGERNELLDQRNKALAEREAFLRQRDVALGEANESPGKAGAIQPVEVRPK